MTALQHIYVTAHGSFDSGPWVGEAAQVGLRIACESTTNMPAKGTTFTMSTHGDVVVDQGQTTGAHGTLTRTWTARRGAPGSEENFDAGFQIDLAEDIWAFLNTVKTYSRMTFSWKTVKMAPISAAGKTIGTSSVYQFTAPLVGRNSAGSPPQLAIALSVRANILGRRGRGRIYLPALCADQWDAEGVLQTATGTALRTAFKTLIDAIQNLPGTPVNIPLVVVTSAGQAMAVRPTVVRTGNRIDTIQSRREQVPETYTSLDL